MDEAGVCDGSGSGGGGSGRGRGYVRWGVWFGGGNVDTGMSTDGSEETDEDVKEKGEVEGVVEKRKWGLEYGRVQGDGTDVRREHSERLIQV